MPFPPTFTNVWDTTYPPDTQLANLLGQDLRNFRTDVMQRMSLLSGTIANRPTPEIVNATWGGAGYGLLFFSTDTAQVFQWNGAAWVDITNSFRFGIISAAVDLTLQQADIAATTILTPTANGFFRASSLIVVTRAATTSSVLPQVQILYTDADSNAVENAALNSTSNNNVVGQLGTVIAGANPPFLYAKTGVAIQYRTIGYASVGATAMQFALHIRLEGPF